MTAKYMKTPVGYIPIREHVIDEMDAKTDREIADQALIESRERAL